MKTAVVTGASYGIGQAITEKLLQAGWKVYGVSRSKPSLQNEHFVWLQCDLSKPEKIAKSLAPISEPALDAFISNAGVIYSETPTEASLESYDATFSVNVLAPMLLVNALREKIARATIISVSSVSDRIPEPDIALYCSSKAANTSYFDSLAQELKDARVFAVLPDYVDTPMQHKSNDDNKDFDWSACIDMKDLAAFTVDLIDGKQQVESGGNIIVVTEKLTDDLQSFEKLYGFNTDTNKLTKLKVTVG